MASYNSSQIPQPQQVLQPPPPPPLDPPAGLSTKIRKLRSRIDAHLAHQTPNAAKQLTEEDEGTTVPRGTWVKADIDEVLEAVLLHKQFSTPHLNTKASDQPKFDDLETYSVTEEQAETLWKREVERLVNVVNSPETSLRFLGQEILKESSKDGYTDLSSIAKRISEASTIWKYDNELLTLVHCKGLHEEKQFQRAQRKLISLESEAKDNATPDGAPNNRYLIAYFALVDYITAVIARLIVQSAHGKLWVNSSLATLAKWATKVKVVSENLPAFASLSLSVLIPQIPRGVKESEEKLGPSDQALPFASDDGTGGIESDAEGTKHIYFLHQVVFRTYIHRIIGYILSSVINQNYNNSGRPITSYEICSVVYETGFAEGFKTLLFQERDGEFMASSDPARLNLAHAAFSILNQTIQEIDDTQRSTCQNYPPPGLSLQTKVRWSYQGNLDETSSIGGSRKPSSSNHLDSSYANRSDRFLTLFTMEDIVTVMIPLLLTSPVIVSNLQDFIQVASLTSTLTAHDILLYAESNFKAFFRMFTSEFEATVKTDVNVSSLSRGLMNRDKLLSGPKLAEILRTGVTYIDMSTGSNENSSISTAAQTTQANAAKIREANRTMNEWIFDEKVVIVKCGFYVWVVTAIGAILVLGGLAIGFTIRNRLPGVDPFSITTYCWILAAFAILVCKSLLVQEWPWRDFLLRRVQCRSVSELQAVTGINAQLILAKLLHDESTTILNTRGPFNSAFTRKADDGFSIDVPLTMWTMLLSGLIMLKVASLQGHALVCLDARRGTKYICIGHKNPNPSKNKNDLPLVCLGLSRPSPGKSNPSQRQIPEKRRFPLKKSELEWKRVLGLYSNRDSEFI